MSPSLCPASSCSMRSFTLAAMTSLLVCGLGAVGREVTLLVSFVVAMLLMGVIPPFFEWLCCVCSTNTPWPMSPRLRGGKYKVGGISHPWRGAVAERKWRPKAGLHKRSAEDWGHSLSRARDGVPQEAWFLSDRSPAQR